MLLLCLLSVPVDYKLLCITNCDVFQRVPLCNKFGQQGGGVCRVDLGKTKTNSKTKRD